MEIICDQCVFGELLRKSFALNFSPLEIWAVTGIRVRPEMDKRANHSFFSLETLKWVPISQHDSWLSSQSSVPTPSLPFSNSSRHELSVCAFRIALVKVTGENFLHMNRSLRYTEMLIGNFPWWQRALDSWFAWPVAIATHAQIVPTGSQKVANFPTLSYSNDCPGFHFIT
jgi:hypothetical protein